jgi:uncharacterized protein involved in exopolysaccharide biosynthesis
MRTMPLALLLVAACGPDPEIGRLNGVIDSLRQQMAAKDTEIVALQARLAEQSMQATGLTMRLEELRAQTEATIGDLRKGLEARAKEALDALAKAGALEQRVAGLDTSLAQAKTALDDTKAALLKRTADLDALKAEFANLKKLLGR